MKLTLQWSSMKYMSIMEGITTGYSELWYNHKMSLLKEFFHVVRIGDLRRTIYDSLPIRISCMTSWSPWWWDLVCAMIQTPKKWHKVHFNGKHVWFQRVLTNLKSQFFTMTPTFRVSCWSTRYLHMRMALISFLEVTHSK